MKSRLSFVLNFLLAFFMLSAVNMPLAHAIDFSKIRTERALFTCLRTNYQKIGVDAFKNDYSYFHPRYLPLSTRSNIDYDTKFGDFLEKQTGDFYKEEVSVKAENTPRPHTVIFAKCVEFSESKVLRDFFRKNPLPVKPNKDR